MHAPYVYNLALRMLGDSSEAEHLSQEAFVRAWRAMPGFRAEARFRTWLYRIVANLCYNRLPALRRELASLEVDEVLELPDRQPPLDMRLEDADLLERLYAAIDELPPSHRLLINLRHLQCLSYAEIAEATGMPLGTVKTGIHRARKRLRATLEQEDLTVVSH